MWGKRIIDNTLKHIFVHNFHVCVPGGKDWFIYDKEYVRVVKLLRMILSWKYGDQLKPDMTDKEVLNFFILYLEITHHDIFLFKTYEDYEF